MSEELKKVTHVENIRYDKETEILRIIDQTLLPNEERFLDLTTAKEMYDAIKTLKLGLAANRSMETGEKIIF